MIKNKENTNTKTRRLQFDFSGDSVKRLDDLKERTHASTRAALVRNALGVYDFLVQKVDAGYDIQFKKGHEIITFIPVPKHF